MNAAAFIRTSAKPLFVEEPHADDAVLIAIGNRGPLRIDVPLHPNDLRIGVIERGYVSEGTYWARSVAAAKPWLPVRRFHW